MPHRRCNRVSRRNFFPAFHMEPLGNERIALLDAHSLGDAGDHCLAPFKQSGAIIRPLRSRYSQLVRTQLGVAHHAFKVEPLVPGLPFPLGHQGTAIDIALLGLPGRQRRHHTRLEPAAAPGFEHLLPPRREGHHRVTVYTLGFEVSVLSECTDPVAKLLDLDPETRHRHGIEQRIVLPQLVVAQRPPLAILVLRHVGDHSVEVQVRFLVAVGVVLEQRQRSGYRLHAAVLCHPSRCDIGPHSSLPIGAFRRPLNGTRQ